MTRTSLVALGLLVLSNVACGGGDKPPATPEPTPTPTETPADPTATTPPPAVDAGTTAAADPTPAPPPAPAKLDLPAASAKLKVNTGKALDLELKSDGTVNSGGKPSTKVSGMELADKDGKAQLKVADDGTITTHDGAPFAKFEGDTLALATGAKYAIGEDGSLQLTPEKGAAKSLGKTEGVGSAKRAALLAVAFATWGTKAPQPKAAAATPAKADKPAADKPAAAKKPAKK